MIAAAVAFGGRLKADCSSCPPRQREMKGCFKPTARPLLTLDPCPECGGRGCRECHGGRIALHRCPAQAVPREAWEVCRTVGLLEAGILPAPGGWYDQAAAWVAAAAIVLREKAQYDEARLKWPGKSQS